MSAKIDIVTFKWSLGLDVPYVAHQICSLLSQLSSTEPAVIGNSWLRDIDESKWHDQFMAIDVYSGRIVGIATMSIILGANASRIAHIEDLVVDEAYRGQGIGKQIMARVNDWAWVRQCKWIDGTTNNKGKKSGALDFYRSCGAEIRDTNNFRIPVVAPE